jgi:hypothetical protein
MDVQFYLVDCIPQNAIKVERQFIAASERSGSFHALFGNYDQYEVDGGFVLDVKEECVLNHSLQQHLVGKSLADSKVLPKKDHRHSVIKPGVYYVGIQNRHDPLSGMKKRVID